MRKFKDWYCHGWIMVSVLVFALPAPASAQTLLGGNFAITIAEEFQSAPAVAANPADGEFLVVWHDLRLDSSFDIFGQRIASDGALIGGNFQVSAGGSNPDVAFNSQTGEFFVVYQRGGIFGRRVAVDGSLIGGEITIFAGVSQTNPAIAYNPISNQYLVVWSQSGGVQGRIVDAAGDPVTAPFFLSTGLVGAGNPAVVFNAATNQYFVVWDAFSPSVTDVFGRLVNADGTFGGNFFALTTAPEIQAFPSVTVNPVTNQYLVVWSDNRDTGTPGADIFGQLVNGDGTLAGGNFPVSTFPFNEGLPTVGYSPVTNEYLAIWVGQSSGGPPIIDVFGQLLGPDGSPLGDAFQVSTAGAAQFSTDLAVNPSTNIFLSVWPDGRNFPESNVDIFGQLIAASSVAALDHFLCYKVKEETKLGDIFVSLEDQFGSDPDVRVKKAKTICVPVDKNGEGINNPDLHLVCYKVKSELKPKKDVLVTNQFGEQILEVKKPDLLCVPSSKEILGDSVGDRDDDDDDKRKHKDKDDDDDD